MSKQSVPLPVVLQNHELRLQRMETLLDIDSDKTVSQLSVVPPASVMAQQTFARGGGRGGGSSSSRTANLVNRRAGTKEVQQGAAAQRGVSGAGSGLLPEIVPPSFDHLRGRLSTMLPSSGVSMSVDESTSVPADSAEVSELREEISQQKTTVDGLKSEVSTIQGDLNGMTRSVMALTRENLELRNSLRVLMSKYENLEKKVSSSLSLQQMTTALKNPLDDTTSMEMYDLEGEAHDSAV